MKDEIEVNSMDLIEFELEDTISLYYNLTTKSWSIEYVDENTGEEFEIENLDIEALPIVVGNTNYLLDEESVKVFKAIIKEEEVS